MGKHIMILGDSGSGKTSSLRNLKANEYVLLNVAGKLLPFRGKYNVVNLRKYPTDVKYRMIKNTITANEKKYKIFVIDDSQYLLSFALFERAKEKGYDKFTDNAVDFKDLLDFIENETDEDVLVYLLHHSDYDNAGKIKPMTIGKMLDEKLKINGLFTIVIGCENQQGQHVFVTNSEDGMSCYKSPFDMFDSITIDNDLKLLDTTIREYYEMGAEDNGKDS